MKLFMKFSLGLNAVVLVVDAFTGTPMSPYTIAAGVGCAAWFLLFDERPGTKPTE